MNNLIVTRQLDPVLLDILRKVDTVMVALQVDYYIVGALARDVVLWHVYGINTGRATRDVDIGIAIDNWAMLASIKTILLQTGAFVDQAKVAHRLYYPMPESALRVPLDLLPFGAVASHEGIIEWPPDGAVVMNVSGFADGWAAHCQVGVSNDLQLPVASLPGLAILKLFAWCARHLHSNKDASDLLLLLRHYCDAGNMDRLYEREVLLLEACGFDPVKAGAMLLGKDARALCNAATVNALLHILTEVNLRQRLQDHLNRAASWVDDCDGVAVGDGFLMAFCGGFGVA